MTVFQRLSQCLKDISPEFRQFIEEQHAMMS
jgi:hypothetical protein